MQTTGNFLNLVLHYAYEYAIDNKVVEMMYECLNRMVLNLEKRSKIDYQLESFKKKNEKFGSDLAMHLKLKHQHNGKDLMEVHILKYNSLQCEC